MYLSLLTKYSKEHIKTSSLSNVAILFNEYNIIIPDCEKFFITNHNKSHSNSTNYYSVFTYNNKQYYFILSKIMFNFLCFLSNNKQQNVINYHKDTYDINLAKNINVMCTPNDISKHDTLPELLVNILTENNYIFTDYFDLTLYPNDKKCINVLYKIMMIKNVISKETKEPIHCNLKLLEYLRQVNYDTNANNFLSTLIGKYDILSEEQIFKFIDDDTKKQLFDDVIKSYISLHQHGGEDNKLKYIKYKQKYIQLKRLLQK